MHADRTNRVMLVLLALILLVAGGAGTAASFGGFGTAVKHRRLLDNRVSRYFGAHGDWLWLVVALVLLLIALLALRWLRSLLFTTDRTHLVAIPTERGTGRSTLDSAALSSAVSGEIQSYPAVVSARTRVIGDPDEPALVVTVSLEESADLPALRQRIETSALAHARAAVGDPNLPIQLDIAVSSKRTRVS